MPLHLQLSICWLTWLQNLDTSSEFIFGQSVNSLCASTSNESQSFIDSFAYALSGVGIRAMLGPLRYFHRDKQWFDACRMVTEFCDEKVTLALARRKGSVEDCTASRQKMELIGDMTNVTQDAIDLRYQALSVFSPAHDSAAITLGNVFFHLCRHPRIWEALRTEIWPSRDKDLSYELLKSYRLMDHVLKESKFNLWR